LEYLVVRKWHFKWPRCLPPSTLSLRDHRASCAGRASLHMAFLAGQRGPFPASRCHTFQTAYRFGLRCSICGIGRFQNPCVKHRSSCMTSTYLELHSAEIPVENIHGPILLLSGKDDQIWPGDMMADKLMARLKQHGHAYHDVHLSYDQVGHWIPCEYLPTAGDFSGLRLVIGGTAVGVAKAQRDSWLRILGFLTQAANAASL
jgi:pimeloyl-ACP methyl ester carboxylesterase